MATQLLSAFEMSEPVMSRYLDMLSSTVDAARFSLTRVLFTFFVFMPASKAEIFDGLE